MKINNNFQLTKYDFLNKLNLPGEMSPELAEFVGIHFGDGCMNISSFTYRLYYSFNARDKEYILYVKDLFYRLFNVTMKVEEVMSKNIISIYFHSKTLCNFFNVSLKVPYSPKKNLLIPEYIKSNKQYLASFLRGLFDTDGCIITQKMRKYSYRLIKICTGIRIFAEDIKFTLKMINIESYICNKKTSYDVVIRRKESFSRFIDIINPKNAKGKNGDAGI